MRNEIKLTDDQIEEVFSNLCYGITIEEVEFTRATLGDFIAAAKDYETHGAIDLEESTLIIERVQARKGDQRKDLVVIDFGTVRGCIRA
jgi:hypothetical protein